MENIFEVGQNLIDNFSRDTVVSKYVSFNMQDTLDTSDAYFHYQFTSGKQDSLGRDKPFFNIGKSKVNIGKRATDLDTKNIRFRATSSDDYFKTFVAQKKLEEWMKKARYASYLNKWGKELAKSGSAVTKYTKKNGELNIDLISWNRLVCDPVDFHSAPVLEKLFLTPQELKSRGYDSDVVKDLVEETTTRKDEEGRELNANDNFIEVWEVHGMMPLSFLTDKEEDDDTDVQQMQVVARILDGEESKDFTLYRGKEKQLPYSIAHWDETDGRTLGVGVMEDLFETQEMVNYSVKATKDQLDLASKMIFKTTDGNLAGVNALLNVETGDFIVTEPGKDVTQLNNQADVMALQNYSMQWQNNAQEITSTPDAISGKTLPSGTPFRSVAIQNQEAHGLFELITENKGLAINDDMRMFIIPFIKTKLDTKEEIVATLTPQEIEWFDKKVVKKAQADMIREKVGKKVVTDQAMIDAVLDTQEALRDSGNTRFLTPGEISWKEYFKDFEWEVDIEITGENLDKQSQMETLFNVMQQIAANPQLLQDKTARTIFNKILETSGGISPVDLPTQPQMQQQPDIAGVSPPAQAGATAGIISGQ